MLGATRGVTASLAGWLWADILLGLFVIFLAASSAPFHASAAASPSPVPSASRGVDLVAYPLTLQVNGAALLGTDAGAAGVEKQRIADDLIGKVAGAYPGRRVAMVLAYATHEDPVEGDRLSHLATERLNTGPFSGATLKWFHNLLPGDRGSTLAVEIYLYQ